VFSLGDRQAVNQISNITGMISDRFCVCFEM
jgi:hypothetical protein